ncbi:uncharacterized protein EDB91DRAFT_1340036, partial [Suillus paluster]|uniref:uncharacterized protein n=1 Tax=Suillus paluster TaxID=48578 RepID=UPI001B883BD6
MKKQLSRLLGRSHSNPHLRVEPESGPGEVGVSSLQPSADDSCRKPPGSVRKFLGKVTNRSTRSAQQPPNIEPAAASLSAQDLLPPHATQDPSLRTAATPTPESNLDQSSNPGIAKKQLNPNFENERIDDSSLQNLLPTQTTQGHSPFTVAPTPEQVSDARAANFRHEVKQLDPKFVNEKIGDASKNMEGMKNVSGMAQNIASASDNLQSIPDTIDTFSAILQPLKKFNDVAVWLADVHPYAKVALSIFTFASKMIIAQADRDAAVSGLLQKISEIYAFMTQDEALAELESMVGIYGKIARQTLECADFITHYSETKSAWVRLGKNIVSETDAKIQSFSEALDS